MHECNSSRYLQLKQKFDLSQISMNKYSTCPNDATLYTEKSHTFKNDWNPFLSFVLQNDWP